ncbi:MAG: SCO family protein [Geminicoccaceae bacterium]
MVRLGRRAFALLLSAPLLGGRGASAHKSHGTEPEARLPVITTAPAFMLTREDGTPFGSEQMAGRVAVVSFVYTSCADICPLLTQRLATVQDDLGGDFGPEVVFVSITMDPETDRPPVLARFAADMGADPKGWAFLTGEVDAIRKVAGGYGVVFARLPDGDVTHNQLTSLVDRAGKIRVQYQGSSFDTDEFGHDIRLLLDEAATG